MGEGKIKRAGAGEKGNESARGKLGREKKRLPFPRFLAVSPLKEPLRRREALPILLKRLLRTLRNT